MYDYNYLEINKYILEILKQEDITADEVLEMACGTGNLTTLLKDNFRVTAFDISDEMLSVSYSKLRKFKNVKLFKGDIKDFKLDKTFPVVLCLCDSLNYILKEEDFIKSIKNTYEHLSREGIFIFDLNSLYYFENILGNNIFSDEKENIYYIWHNEFSKEKMLNTYNVDFFVEDNKGKYDRFFEEHIERAFEHEYVLNCLTQAGFKNVDCFNGYSFNKDIEKAQRIIYIARK